MTSLANRVTKLRFATEDTVREKGKYRAVVVEAHTTFCRVRLQGLHDSYDLPWSAIRDLAVKLAVRSAKAEKAAKKSNHKPVR